MEKPAPPEAETEDGPSPAQRPVRKRPRRGVRFARLFSFGVACLVFVVLALALSGRTLPVPEPLRAMVERAVNDRLAGAPVRIRAMEVGIDRSGAPQLVMHDIRFADSAGGAAAQLNWLGAELSLERMLRREFAAEVIYLSGAQITIRRTAAGRFTLSAGSGFGGGEQSITELLTRIDAAMNGGAVSSLSEVVAGGVVLTLEDARSGRIWQATNVRATLRNTSDSLSLSITTDVFNGSDDLAGMQVSLTRSRATEHVQFGVKVQQMPAADIALQSPVLAWLGVLDAPISGAVRTELDETGALASFAGTLDISNGALRPDKAVRPVEFDAAKAYFTFDPLRQRIDFSEISFASEQGRAIATGQTYLAEFDGVWPEAFLGQFRVEDFAYVGGDAFDGPIALDDIRADLRVRLEPFSVEFGEIVIDNAGTNVTAQAHVTGGETGWRVALDATTPEIATDRVLEFWPRRVSPITRGWLSRNLSGGRLHNPALGLRFEAGSKPDLALSFEFDDGLVRFLPEMPKLTGAAGRAILQDDRFSLALTSGEITAEDGQVIDASGSEFTVLDTKPKPAWGEIRVAAAGRLDAVLRVLNNRPLRLMERAKRPVDLARADVNGSARIQLPLQDGMEADEVTYDVTAELTNVSSESLVPDRLFTSPRLRLTATPEAIGLSGPAELDGVPLVANWRQPLGAAANEGGEITGQVTLSSDAVTAFDLPLPEGSLSGQGQADYTLRLPADPDLPPSLRLSSDLAGISLGIDALGWRKPPEERGILELAARLGETPTIEELALKTNGLSFEGSLDIAANGGLDRARFRALELGRWLNAEVELTPSQNGGPPKITVLGGTVDLRQLELAAGAGNGGGSSGPIDLTLDRLIVSDGISLSPVRGRITVEAGGLSGSFDARVNGRTPIKGVLSPANAGTAIRISSDNAAGVLRDAGLTPNARRGRLDLVLTPVSNAPSGTFDGEFLIEDMYLRDAPVMAELLDAISVVGLVDQLGGAGIRFSTVDGRFRLNRRQLRLIQAAAVGPSMGISADGLYDLRSERMDFQGVVSPVYFLNGIGSVLTRRGEGLFGFNYRMAGAAADPSVRVNPLSILTPGAFRQIFRRAPPGG